MRDWTALGVYTFEISALQWGAEASTDMQQTIGLLKVLLSDPSYHSKPSRTLAYNTQSISPQRHTYHIIDNCRP
jgi:hypothetical protein